MKDITKKYSNGEVTVIWKPKMCIHSEKCFHGLPGVFNPKQRPWVNAEGADTQTIIDQIKQCPSGALSYELEGSAASETEQATDHTQVDVAANGPLLVHGSLQVKLKDGSVVNREKMTAFCRCGLSANKPFCDGSHRESDFDQD